MWGEVPVNVSAICMLPKTTIFSGCEVDVPRLDFCTKIEFIYELALKSASLRHLIGT